MRLRLMATYLGVPYQAGLGPDGTEATLFSPGPPPEELGFAAAAGHWRKQVSVTDLDALWQARPAGDYRGEPCLVLDDLGDRLHIAYLGRDAARAAQLGYWEIDREVFEVVVARQDVTGLAEDRVDFPLTAAMFPASGFPASGFLASGFPASGFPASGGQPSSCEEPPPRAKERAATGTPAEPATRAEYATPAGFGGADHCSSMPDRMAAWHGSPEPWPAPDPPSQDAPWSDPWTEREAGSEPETAPVPRRRTRRKDRISPESVFAELMSLAAIPQAAYAVDKEVPGAMCLVEADGGFEVFSRTDDARLEVHFFEDEEAAYFYLFGVLAAEAIRSGRLAPTGPACANGHHNGSVPAAPQSPARTSPTSAGNVSKNLRGKKLHKSAPAAARVK